VQYTLGELKREARQWLLETSGAPGGDNPLLWNTLAVRATDRLSRETHCYHGARLADVVEDQIPYCAPGGIFRITGVYFKDDDDFRRLRLSPPTKMEANGHENWRTIEGVAVPSHGILAAPSGPFYLYPPCSADVTGGLRFEGYIAPGEEWTFTAGVPDALTDASINPLPTWAQDALPVCMAYLRCIQYPTDDNMKRFPGVKEEYRKLRGMVEQQSAGHYGEGKVNGMGRRY
jgi:hypothetical protein